MRSFSFLLLAFLVLFQYCNNAKLTPSREVYNEEFNWRIQIPAGFDSVPPEQWAKTQNRGADAIEKTYGSQVENRSKTIFVFQSDKSNYFESNYQPFDPAVDGNYLDNFNSVNGLLYHTFETQMPNAQLDSSSSQESIDGKIFQTFRTKVKLPQGKTLECLMYSRLFGTKEFTVNIITMDKEKQELLLDVWKKSTFGDK